MKVTHLITSYFLVSFYNKLFIEIDISFSLPYNPYHWRSEWFSWHLCTMILFIKRSPHAFFTPQFSWISAPFLLFSFDFSFDLSVLEIICDKNLPSSLHLEQGLVVQFGIVTHTVCMHGAYYKMYQAPNMFSTIHAQRKQSLDASGFQ